jgi:hypothetical protein
MIDAGGSKRRGRLVAVVIAIALVGGALAVRNLVIDNDDGGSSGSGDDGRTRVVCANELRDVCTGLDADVTVEAAGTTADRLVAATDPAGAGFDLWLTAEPWAEIVERRRADAGADPLLSATNNVFARTPLVLVARTNRADVLVAACDGEITWTCVGDRAGTAWSEFGGDDTWGNVRPAHAEPVNSVHGLLALGHAVGTYVATPEVPVDDVSLGDWQNNDAFPGWFQQLERSIPANAFTPGQDPFDLWLQTRGAAYDLVATTEAAALTALDDAAPDVRDASSILYPAPVATADIMLAPVGEAEASDRLLIELQAALREQGFRTSGAPSPEGAPTLPNTDGLPPAGSLDALRNLWQDVVR